MAEHSSASKKFQTLGVQIHALVLTHISTFFDQPIETYSPVSPKELNFFIQTYNRSPQSPPRSPLSSKPSTALTTTQLLDGYISESLAIRYHSFVIEKDGSAAEDEGAALEMLATGVLEELRVFSEVFDGLILEKFHIPTIAARIYIEGLALRIEEYVSSLMSSTAQVIPLDTGFKVYSIAKELVGVCEKIDYRLVERLKIQTWFRPFLEEFVGISESKINEWVHNAVLVDDQQLEFILKLEWPSQHDTAMFIGKLIENIGEGIEKYALLMKQSISSDLKAAPTHTKANSNTSQQPLATSPYKLKLKVRKQGPPIDPSELRVSPKSCVKLSNIEFLLSRFNELMETVPREYKETWRSSTESLTVPSNPPPTVTSPLKPIRRNTRKAVAQMRPRVAGTLSILHTLDLHPVRPFATEVSIRICTMPSGRETRNNLGDGNSARPSIGRELGRTQKMHQSKKIVFMEESARGTGSSAEIPILLTDMDIERGLQLLIVHHVPVTVGASASASPGSAGGTYAGNEYLIAMEGFAMDHVVMTAVKSGAAGVIFGVSVYGGMVMLRLVIQQGVVVNIVKERLGYVVGRTVEESTRIIVDKLCYDLRQRLKDASAGHKQSVIIANNILNLFSSESTKKKLQTPLSSSEKPTETEVDTKLAPLLDFIDANLSIIAATIISVPLANRVVQGIWERFIDVADGLVVPNLGDDNGLLDRKKQWEESRVAFLGHTVGIVKDFLHADGNGLPLAQMEIESLGQLELTLLHYSWGRKELWQKHLSEMSRFMNWSDAWLLKLIKLKGGYGDYVVEAMRRKVEGIY
ncbi:hypothetical protein BCR33DRAFT_741419 [Rhizoclosmatium globosum]|uniref:MHD2 domain-containing protein n=1 Tax=Rhizoclosmatium globosum TaxID=329046 RepID=A0A1Y2BUV0_9FUNG|nr:hypothetical protein BCR33DRAFT_741419 [Rhizoclosmatium globosum]|eukprot:ORY38542.1 hypothetical protein BCR33DRAFT_741419 [Rhizoclosmatium globosum]